MNKLLCMFVAASLVSACSEQPKIEPELSESKVIQPQVDPQLLAWVGDYSGVIPCDGCISRCPDCEGMAIDLEVTPDMKFKLIRTSLSEHNDPEILNGSFSFLDDKRLKIELANIKGRETLILGSDYIEIIDTESDLPYKAYQDFRIYKQA